MNYRYILEHYSRIREILTDNPRATLQEAEKMWLVACLAAMGNKRFSDILCRYDSKQGGRDN